MNSTPPNHPRRMAACPAWTARVVLPICEAKYSRSMTDATLYLRLSDFRDDSDGFSAREARLRTEAKRLGWTAARVVVENDVIPNANGNGRSRPASAFKRRKITTPSGRTEWRVYRPGFRSIVDDLAAGRTG